MTHPQHEPKAQPRQPARQPQPARNEPAVGDNAAQPEKSVFIPATKVLSAEEMKILRIADRFRDEARRLHESMSRTVAEAQENARKKGHQQGFEQGRLEALESLVEAINGVRQRLAASDEELAGIVVAAVEGIIGAMDDHDLALRCVRRALDDAAGDIWAKVHVTPPEVAYLEEGLRKLPMTGIWPEIRGVEADPLLKPGEIILETPKGRTHVGIRQQLSRLKAGLESLDGAQGKT